MPERRSSIPAGTKTDRQTSSRDRGSAEPRPRGQFGYRTPVHHISHSVGAGNTNEVTPGFSCLMLARYAPAVAVAKTCFLSIEYIPSSVYAFYAVEGKCIACMYGERELLRASESHRLLVFFTCGPL